MTTSSKPTGLFVAPTAQDAGITNSIWTVSSLVGMIWGKQIVWEGVVESFALSGNPKAKGSYARSFQEYEESQYVMALEIPPVEIAHNGGQSGDCGGGEEEK
jgi:hypothetical protein